MPEVEWDDPTPLEEALNELYGNGYIPNVADEEGQKIQTVFAVLQAVRLREQARYTRRMALFVGLASVAQVVTVLLAIWCG